MRHNSLTTTFLSLFLSLTIIGIGGCGGPTGTPGDAPAPGEVDTETPVPGDWLVENIDTDLPHLNPLIGSDAGTSYLGLLIFDTLLNLDNETLEFIPRLATDWEVSEDHLEYTFHMDEEATFHDGEPVTAEDVKFTIDAINNPANDTAVIRSYLVDVEKVEVLDEYTVKFVMKKPYFRHLIVLGLLEILPEHIYGEGDLNAHPNNRDPIGSGPYQFEEWDAGQQIVLTRNEDYHLEKPYIKKRVFRIITDPQASFQVLQRHEIDMMRFQPELWVTKASTPSFEAEFNKYTPDSPIPGTFSRYNYIGWNTRRPMFEDKRVRRAMTMLFDRELIVETVWYGLGTIITGSMYHESPEYDQSIDPWPFDPERAEELLDEAGWVDSNNNGIRDKDGVEFEFELSFGSGVPEYDQLGTVYQEELKRAGIKVTLNPIEWVTFQERLYERSFDAVMLAWITPILQDPYQLWHSTQAEDGSNHPGLKMDEIDEILESARLEFDRDKRIELYHRLHEILHDQQPYTFLYARPGLIAVDKRFHGVKVYDPGLDPTEWWAPKALQRYE